MATSTKTTPEGEGHMARAVVIGLAALVAVFAAALLSFVGFGFFFIPIILGAIAIGIFVFSLRRVGFRNEMSDDQAGLDRRYADGQPIDRSLRRQFGEDEERPPPPSSDGPDGDMENRVP